MSGQVLDRVLACFRIGDPEGAFPIFDAAGSKIYPGRWNDAAHPVLYAAEHYSTAMLEKLVHGNGRLPPNQHFIEISVPPGVSYEIFSQAHHPGWDAEDCAIARRFGVQWLAARRSLILIAPSIVARVENTVLINPEHPDFPKITASLHKPVWWDRRLFSG